MNYSQIFLTVYSCLSLIILIACANSNQVNNNNAEPTKPATTVAKNDHSQPSKGGQVVEVGKYHLELVTLKESTGTHIDFYLQTGDTHAAIPNAKVTAQIQSPTGEKRTLNLKYDVTGKHYTALLPEKTPGEYKIVMLSDIKGEKVNGRFSFKQ